MKIWVAHKIRRITLGPQSNYRALRDQKRGLLPWQYSFHLWPVSLCGLFLFYYMSSPGHHGIWLYWVELCSHPPNSCPPSTCECDLNQKENHRRCNHGKMRSCWIRVDLSSMTDVLMRRGKFGHRNAQWEDCHVTMKDEFGRLPLQAKEPQGVPATTRS